MTEREEGLNEQAAPQGARRSATAASPQRTAPRDHARVERENREPETMAGEGRPEEISDDDRFLMFQDSIQQSVLPDLPPMPGWHVCWLTTSNPRDTIPMRMRWGYELIRPDMVPGWEKTNLKTGDYGECIVVNEMIAARIRLTLYRRYMTELHHDMPLSEEEKIKAQVEMLRENAEASGAKLIEGDGTAGIVQKARSTPVFQA